MIITHGRLPADELQILLEHLQPPEYVQWHRERIVSCLDFLQQQVALNGLKTLDLGHDRYVGALMAHLGCDLRGNVAPDGLGGHEAARGEQVFVAPDGRRSAWMLDAFDFESPFPYPDESFDLVTMMEVIEHVSTSPREVLAEIRRVLKPGGRLFVTTPNAACWAKIVRQFDHAQTYDAMPYSQEYFRRHPMCHVYEYTPWELKHVLGLEGFETQTLETWNPYPSDPRGWRDGLPRTATALALALTGNLRRAALMFHQRGHLMALIAKRK